MKKHIPAIIFFGAIWGIVEATLGYLLHVLPISIYISGTILFPIVGYILYRAYAVTQSKTALLSIGVVAALIKAVNFFLPFGSPFKIINPMLSIVLESLMVVLVISVLNKDDMFSKVKAMVIASIGWRLLYLAYNGIQYLSNGFVSAYLETFGAALNFTLVLGFISAVIGVGILYLDKVTLQNSKPLMSRINPAISFATLLVAVVLTYFL